MTYASSSITRLDGREFTDGIAILGSCYGHHIFSRKDGQPSQWERLVRLLQIRTAFRRAVLQLFMPEPGLDPDTKDAPCTCSVQFLIRNDRLHAIVYMRSNDSIWGLPYDVFLFSTLQELLTVELGAELGSYHHLVGSLHLYRRHFELAKRIISSRASFAYEMPPIEAHHELPSFLKIETFDPHQRSDKCRNRGVASLLEGSPLMFCGGIHIGS